MGRYAAKILFQFYVPGGKRRVCEERILSFESKTPHDAVKYVKLRGKEEEYDFKNSDGVVVKFQYIGILQLKNISDLSPKDEYWYEIKEMYHPKEREAVLIPKIRDLDIFYEEKESVPIKEERRKRRRKRDSPRY